MLQVDNISVKVGRKGPTLLHDVSLKAAAGEFIVVLGANGAGKSTLLRAIGGGLDVASGTICWKDRLVKDWDLADMALERGFLDQHSTVPFAFTAREVVMMGRYPHLDKAAGPMDAVAVDRALDVMRAMPYMHRTMPSLSGGEQKRIHIARIIAQLENGKNEATLMLLDEPLNDLDVKHQHALLAFAQSRTRAGHCVVAVLHDVNMASQYADRIILMGKGMVIAQGTPSEVLKANNLSVAYDMDAHVTTHPITGSPWVHFGDVFAQCPAHLKNDNTYIETMPAEA